jgi:xylitol oxidase
MSSERLAEIYPRLDDFRALISEYDPDGRFRNPYLNHAIFGDE